MTEDLDEWSEVLELAANSFSTPFYLLRLPIYQRRVARLKTDVEAHLRGCALKQWYSYKTLPVPHFAISANKECGVGIEITSDYELSAVLAAGIATKAEGIWAHDPHFREQKKMKVFTNIDLLRISGKIKF